MLEVAIAAQKGSFRLEVAFAYPPGHVVAVFGPSGAGKSTLLAALAGTLPTVRGRIAWEGTAWLAEGRPPLPPWRRPVGFLGQEPFLLRRRSVEDNLLLVPGATREAALTCLGELGLAHLAGRPAGQLSGGEAHLVALARLLLRPHVLSLLDEPWAHLDRRLGEEVAEVLLTRLAAPNRLVLFVSHAWEAVERLADQVLLVDGGRLYGAGSPVSLMANPPSRTFARLFGYVGVVAAGTRRYLVHPGRLLPGAHPERGPVVPVRSTRRVLRHGLPAALAELPGGVDVLLPGTEGSTHVTLIEPPSPPPDVRPGEGPL